MAKSHGTFMTGYVTVVVKGRLPELFFQRCAKEGIPAWDIRKTGIEECQGNIEREHISAIRKIRRDMECKISFIDKRGLPFIWHRFLRKREIVAASILSLLLIVFLSNVLWKVEITGLPKELENKIEKQLKGYGVYSGAWLFSLDEPSTIQHKLLQDVPELLWIGVKKKGTSIELQGVEKTVVKEQKPKGPQNLVATKKGVIKKIYVSKGIPMKKVDDYVEKGDLLVSGELNSVAIIDEEAEDEQNEEGKGTIVAADGDIRARTWYETKVTVPLVAKYETLTGNQKQRYYMRFGDFHLPVWGFKNPDYKLIHREYDEEQVRFLKWDMPMHFVAAELSEKQVYEKKRTKEEATQFALEQAKQELKLQLGQEARIVSGKVLHETIENGKVKLTLYMTVEEDIAVAEPIQSK